MNTNSSTFKLKWRTVVHLCIQKCLFLTILSKDLTISRYESMKANGYISSHSVICKPPAINEDVISAVNHFLIVQNSKIHKKDALDQGCKCWFSTLNHTFVSHTLAERLRLYCLLLCFTRFTS